MPRLGGTGILLRSYELSPGPLVATPPTPANVRRSRWHRLEKARHLALRDLRYKAAVHSPGSGSVALMVQQTN